MMVIQILISIGISIVVICVIIFVGLCVLDSMGVTVDKICQDQFKDCASHNGTFSYVECNCHPYFFSDKDCKDCFNSAGYWCTYPNGTGIKCEVIAIG